MEIKNVLILGIGGVGYHLARRLIHEGYDVTIIEADADLIRFANENLDARVISGNAMEHGCWKAARAEKMDLLLAVTNNDSLNMLASLIADRFGIPRKIARVRSLDFGGEDSLLSTEHIKTDLLIHPEELVAQEIARLVRRTAANDVIQIGQGQMKVFGMRVLENSSLVNKSIKEISELYPNIPLRIITIARGITTIIPKQDEIIYPYDTVFIMLIGEDLPKLMSVMGIQQRNIYRVMILGGGMVGRRVAELLEKYVKVTLIEKDAKKAEELSTSLKNTEVLNGDGTDANILIMAGLMDMETYIATTSKNETNIISCLLAKHLMNKQNRDPNGGLGKTIALVNKEDYLVLSSTIGLDVALSAKISAANEILKFIHRGGLLSVAHLHGVDAEVVEFEASAESPIVRKPLHKLSSILGDGILIGGIIRDNTWNVAMENTQIQDKDRVIVVCTSHALKDVRRLFQ